ncbi:MAG TPA: hypothetical protein VMU89_05140 [Thermomicrobiaceae bacterium]|nr:hypothetical protein [Thermomicrobiaceae bacterium]
MARGWWLLSSRLGRFSTLVGAAGATTTATPGLGVLLGTAVALAHLRRPRSLPRADVPDHTLMATRLRAAVEQGSLAGKSGLHRPTPER